ncbi:MAG TPA: hypothetical protein VF218_11845 [Acidothermaceae bacterium]|jgi:hypothetical protein
MPRVNALPHDALRILAAEQDGVVRRRQLHDLGISDDAVRARLLSGKWRLAARGVVVLHNGPPTELQKRWIALLANPGAALAGITSAQEYGLQGFDDGQLYLLVPHRYRAQRLQGVRIHESRRFDVNDIHPARSLPTVRAERALIDAASWTPWPRRACAILAAGVQQGLTTGDRLRAELAAATRARHRGLLDHVLADIQGGADSFAEIDLGRLARLAHIPPPRRQVFRLDRAGRRRWLDADCDGFSVEVDGAIHLKPLRYWDDMERQNDLIIVTGKPMLRFATVAIRLLPEVVIAQLAAAHARFGRS